MTSRVRYRGPWAHGTRLTPYKTPTRRPGRYSRPCPRCRGLVRGGLGEAKVCTSCIVQLALF